MMTADKSHATDHGIEKQSVKPGDKPPAGTPITEKADNAVQQRQETQLALKAYRFTKGDNPFTIDMGNGEKVQDKRPLANTEAPELIAFKTPEPSTPAEKSITGAALIKIAEKLGHDSHRWEQTKDSPDPKCNQYVEAVLKEGHIPFPWKAGYADCHAMRQALDKECQRPGSKWEKVYVYDDKHGDASDEKFTHYVPKNGDVMIWDGQWGNEYVQHSGIAAEPYDILYAGCWLAIQQRAPWMGSRQDHRFHSEQKTLWRTYGGLPI